MLRLLRPSPLTFFTGAAILVLTSVFLLETGFTPSLHYHSSRSAQNGEGTSSSALRQLLDHSRGAKEQSGLASPRYEEFGPSGVSVEQERSFQEIRSEFHVRSPFQGSLSDSDLKMPMLLPQSEFGGEIVTESEPMTGKPGTTTEDASYEWEEQELDLIKTPVVDMLHKLSPDTTNKYAINSKPISGTIGSMFQNTSEFLPEDRFAIRDPFHLPFPAYTLPLSELTTKPWFTELKKYLSNMSPKVAPVGVVTSDFKFRQILINWLINALVRVSPPVENVIVFSLDEPLHDILKTRGIPCVYIPPEDFMNPRVHLYRHLAFTHVMVMRLTVMRLINHWGFDAINYDSDAIVLKNLAAVFEQYKESDVITSSGKYPKEVRDMWGVTACAGLWMARSSQRTGTHPHTLTHTHVHPHTHTLTHTHTHTPSQQYNVPYAQVPGYIHP